MRRELHDNSFEKVGLPCPVFWNRINITSSITGTCSVLASLAFTNNKANSTSHSILTNLSKISLTVFTLSSLYQVYEHVKYEEVADKIRKHNMTFLRLINYIQHQHDSSLEYWLDDQLKQYLSKHAKNSSPYLWRDVTYFCLNPQNAGHTTQVNILKALISYYEKIQNNMTYNDSHSIYH